mmetsp:Transcript_53932/g.155747  ORF Transcript_53932/g.155747 Transcript_53932/m.155747 type:complete len:116 (-) Transcript_53932:40-387(-)
MSLPERLQPRKKRRISLSWVAESQKRRSRQKTTSKVLKLDSVWRPVETEAEAAAVGEAAVKVAEAEVKGEAVVDVEDVEDAEAVVGEVKAVVEEDGALASMSWMKMPSHHCRLAI